MPHPVPELQEILALEAKIRGDVYDLSPQPNMFARFVEVKCLSDNPIWIKKK